MRALKSRQEPVQPRTADMTTGSTESELAYSTACRVCGHILWSLHTIISIVMLLKLTGFGAGMSARFMTGVMPSQAGTIHSIAT